MEFTTPLIGATLVRRYKRFLADVTLDDGREVTAHVANPGSMMGMADAGTRVWLEPNDDPKRKLKFSWKVSETTDDHFICVDTSMANKVIGAALATQDIQEMAKYQTIQSEVKYSKNSRVDFLCSQDGLPDVYLEVKSVTLSRQVGLAEFPDSVTKRGAKHMDDLGQMVDAGHRAILLYLINRTDCQKFDLARDIDPIYDQACKIAIERGVELLCYSADIDENQISLGARIEF